MLPADCQTSSASAPVVYHCQQGGKSLPQLTRCPTTWGAFVEAMSYEHDERHEKDGPGFIMADFSTPYRRAENVTVYTAVCLDMDTHAGPSGRPETPPSPTFAVEQLRRTGLAGFVYTTHNHEVLAAENDGKPTGPRYRVIIPLLAPIAPSDLERVTRGAARMLWMDGPGFDPVSWVVGQFFFMPSCRPGGVRLSAAVDGQMLDPAGIADQQPELPEEEPAPPPSAAAAPRYYPMHHGSLFDDTKARARGQWRGILSSLGIGVPSSGVKHSACPGCGGKDRFRFDDKDGSGSWLCSQGGAGTLAGDGFDLVQHVRHTDAAGALRMVRDAMGLEHRRPAAPARAPAPAVVPPGVDADTGEIVADAPAAPPAPANDNDDRLADLLRQIDEGRTIDRYEQMGRQIAADRSLSTMHRERLAKALQTAFTTFHDTKPPISEMRKLVGIVKSRAGVSTLVELQDQHQAPDWVKPWVFRTDCDQFFSLVTKESISTRSFDFKFSRLVPPDLREAVRLDKPSEMCSEIWNTQVVGGACYMPIAGEVFTLDGTLMANTYRPDIVPDGKPEEDWTDDECETVRLMGAHLTRLAPNPDDRHVLLQWLAWAVQRPGDKVNWAPLLIGTYGDGKSLIANMLGEVMGKANVRILSGNSVVESAFTGWGEGSCVTAIEEVRLSGQNRFEVMDRLKPFITNDRVDVHAKHRDQRSVPNTVSYIIFSNWMDAVPVDDKDRRYFVLMTPFVGFTGDQLAAAGMDHDYFSRLFCGVEKHAQALRGWLLGVDVSDFNAKGRAPGSESKASVVEYCRTDDEIAVVDALERTGLGVSKDVFSSTGLSRVMSDMGHAPLRTTTLNRVLQGLGYNQVKERVKWNGEKHRVWISSSMPRDMDATEARNLLERTRMG